MDNKSVTMRKKPGGTLAVGVIQMQIHQFHFYLPMPIYQKILEIPCALVKELFKQNEPMRSKAEVCDRRKKIDGTIFLLPNDSYINPYFCITLCGVFMDVEF